MILTHLTAFTKLQNVQTHFFPFVHTKVSDLKTITVVTKPINQTKKCMNFIFLFDFFL